MEVLLPVAGVEVNVLLLVLLGAVIGFMSGMFGVGGGFLLTPAMYIFFHIPYEVAIGSSLAQMIGTSASGVFRHRKLGNIDYKLGLVLVCVVAFGVETGARIVELLERVGTIHVFSRQIEAIDFYVSLAYIVLLAAVGTSMFVESRKALKRPARAGKVDSAFARHIKKIKIPPLVSFPKSGVHDVSVWVIVGIAFCVGTLSGLLGVGGGFVMVPALIYLIGVPTTVAVGTGLFQTMFASLFGTISHYQKGNVDLTLAAAILAGSVVAAQFGAIATKKLRGANIRWAFSLVTYLTAVVVLGKLLHTFELF